MSHYDPNRNAVFARPQPFLNKTRNVMAGFFLGALPFCFAVWMNWL